ncbi:MAG TPA: heme exporter protein CcmB [Gemmatimonadales bacterium]|nr:heme exporter protein CcmB [Gemmatimonadales bacterium]
MRSTNPAPRPPGMLEGAWLIARKDLSIEYRTRSAFLAALAFALVSVVVFRFAWDPTTVTALDLAPGVLWVIFTFSGLLGLFRSFGVELAEGAMDGLLGAPVSREAIFLGKFSANLVFVVAVQAVTIPAVVLFYNLALGSEWIALAGVAVLASIGLVAVGTLFSAMALNTRMAELLLPVLTLPFFVPVVVPAAQATVVLLGGRPIVEALPWLRILLAFDLVFLFACTSVFRFTVEE